VFRIFTSVALRIALTSTASAAWIGAASYYKLSRRTANGGHVEAFSAAHRTLPFGTRVRVTNLTNNRSVIVTINDRGPLVRGRLIDVSSRAARALGFHSGGVAQVKVELAGK
jgi:rare lipoprotein A